jgi:hypothetical protein
MNSRTPVKVAIWLYFWLLLLEGALRKWVFPQLSDVIFVIRDPVAVLTYVLAWRAGLFPRRPALVAVWVMALLSLAFSFAGDAPILVTIFGLRTNYLHLPMVFVIAAAMNRDDVVRLGRWFLLCAVPIAVLMMIQFNAPPDALVNVGVGGLPSGQLLGAMGHIRAPGPFSFVAGPVGFFPLVAAFTLHGWLHRGTQSRILLAFATLATAVAIPTSISRSLLMGLLVVVVFGLVSSLRDPRRLPAYLGPLVAIGAFFLFIGQSAYVEAFRTRWDEALQAGEGTFYSNIIIRIVEEFTQPFTIAASTPLLGHGIGLGTIAGARLTSGEYQFLLAESELARVILELGPLLGFAFLLWRAWLAGLLVVRSWRMLHEGEDPLAWLLTGACFLPVLSGQWGPATQLGFAVLGAGLALAALNSPVEEEPVLDTSAETE